MRNSLKKAFSQDVACVFIRSSAKEYKIFQRFFYWSSFFFIADRSSFCAYRYPSKVTAFVEKALSLLNTFPLY